jgi:pimeloyl-ACP methyl ester carboxylesterase
VVVGVMWMPPLRWLISFLLMPFLWRRSIPLDRPNRIDWNPSLVPQTLQIKGSHIFYVVKGEGDPLLLIHGYGAAIWVWEKQIDILSQSHRVYALDLIGHGFSDRPKIPYTPETYIYFLRDFMDKVGMEKATLIGNSMGGGIAWAVAVLFPERVNRLVLIDCAPPDVLGQVKNESFRMLVAIKDIPYLPYLIFSGGGKNSLKRILQECVSNINLITPEILNRQYQLSKMKGSSWALYSTFRNAEGAMEFKGKLSQIHHPTLLLWGEEDQVFSPSVGKSLHQEIVGSKFQLIEKSGHIPMWETPDKVNHAILSFLRE